MAIRIGMVGGGQGAFIGAVHRMCMRIDGEFELVAGCFSQDPENTRATGRRLGLDPGRCYDTWDQMMEQEARLPDETRIEAISIVTPNHVHHGPARAALEAGLHVICDKPLCMAIEGAEDLAAAVERSGRVFALTHNYSGYPMVREARELVASGALGEIRKVYAEYLQGWLSEALEKAGQKQAEWRTDPARAGPAGALGDIGTHAFHLLEHVTGLRVRSLLAVLETFVKGRALDDDDMLLLRLEGGATGTLCSSQVCFGRENGLALRVFGTRGALEWRQEHPNDLCFTDESGAVRTLRAATTATGEASRSLTRTPPGHPEGYIEGFANIYRAFARAVRRADGEGRAGGDGGADAGGEIDLDAPYPTIADGVRGIRFIAAALESSREGRWVELR
ncbi:MAG: Gfo/Idh/MocA family protein [Planctomycetota bacterium]